MAAEKLALQADREGLRLASHKTHRAEASAREAASALDGERARIVDLAKLPSPAAGVVDKAATPSPAGILRNWAQNGLLGGRTLDDLSRGRLGTAFAEVADTRARPADADHELRAPEPQAPSRRLADDGAASQRGSYSSERLGSVARAEEEARDAARMLELRLAEQDAELMRTRRPGSAGGSPLSLSLQQV